MYGVFDLVVYACMCILCVFGKVGEQTEKVSKEKAVADEEEKKVNTIDFC